MGLAPAAQPGQSPGWVPLDGAWAGSPWTEPGLGAPRWSPGWEPPDRARAGCPPMEPGLGVNVLELLYLGMSWPDASEQVLTNQNN